MMAYRLSGRADQDILDIYDWGCETFGRHQAEHYHHGLVKTFEMLAAHPLMARERSEFGPGIRLHLHRAHLVVYLLDDDGIVLVRVLHRHQQWESLM